MLSYAKIDLFYKSALMRSVRLLLAFFLIFLIASEASLGGGLPKFSLFFLGLFLMSEIFYHFHIAQYKPELKVSENTGNMLLSSTKDAVELYLASPTTFQLIQRLLRRRKIQYFLAKLAIDPKEIVEVTLDNTTLLTEAAGIANKTGGGYVTTLDLLCSYLLFTDPQRKLLFNKEIKPEELVEFVGLERYVYESEELPKPMRIHFTGVGFGEALISGWTPLTQQFTVDWTQKAFSMRRHLTGREKEYQALCDALSRKENNNVLLVGEPGVGKSNLLVGLAHDSFRGVLPPGLNHKHLLELMVSSLLAGATNQGDLEERMNTIIAEISHAGNVILYVPELQNVLGSSDFKLNISGALLPHLQDGRLPIIASISPGNFKTYLEKNPLREVFSTIHLEPPDEKTALVMLLTKASEIESNYTCIISLKAIMAANQHAHTFLPDEVLPGSAVKLLSEAANRAVSSRGKHTIVNKDDIVSAIEQKTHVIVGAPKKEEKELLLHLEDRIHERVINQETAVKAIAEAIRRIRSGLAQSNKPISFLFLGPTGVGKTETAKALADIYFHGENHMIRLDMSEYADTEGVKRLLGAPPGEGEERGELTDKIHDNPYSLILLDEFEKAHPTILDLFLQVFEDGRLTDNKGRTVSFDNAIIIATSNAASEYIREKVNAGKTVDKTFQQELLEYLQTKNIFKPELLNRFDEVITFAPLGELEVRKVVKLLLVHLTQTLKEQDINLLVTEDVVAKIAKEGFDPQFGARPLRRYIQNNLEDLIAKMKLEDAITRGNTVSLTIDQQGSIAVGVS